MRIAFQAHSTFTSNVCPCPPLREFTKHRERRTRHVVRGVVGLVAEFFIQIGNVSLKGSRKQGQNRLLQRGVTISDGIETANSSHLDCKMLIRLQEGCEVSIYGLITFLHIQQAIRYLLVGFRKLLAAYQIPQVRLDQVNKLIVRLGQVCQLILRLGQVGQQANRFQIE